MTVESLIKEAISEVLGHEKSASKPFDAAELKKVSNSLEKIAALPYKEEAYDSVCGIMKLASNSINEVLSELNESKNRLVELEKISEIRGVIDEMLDRGLIDRFDVQEKTAELFKKSAHEMEVIKEAICLTTDNISKNIFASHETEKVASNESSKREMFSEVL